MGCCAAKPATTAASTTDVAGDKERRPSKTEGVVKKMRRASANFARRASGLVTGAPPPPPPGSSPACAPRQKLDPSKNVSQLVDGTWKAHHEPDRQEMLKAAHLPYIIRKILLSLGNPGFGRRGKSLRENTSRGL